MKHVNVALFVPHLGCPHTCIFCNQRIISGQVKPLEKEDIIRAAKIAAECEHDVKNSEIAFFGGSFTAIDRKDMIACLEAAYPFIGRDFGGIRISTRPDCINSEILSLLSSYGVTAIELGAQSMSQRVLTMNERGHTPEDTVKACALIKEAGFSLGLQMMTGLYGATEADDRYTAGCFCNIKPDTVRIYPTVVLEGTCLHTLYKEGKYVPPSLEQSVDLCADLLVEFHLNGIKVIRLGLHSGGNVEEGFAAGVYHPAFRELCEALIYRKEAEKLLENEPRGSYNVYVGTREISKMTGQKKSNTEYFSRMGYDLKILPDAHADIYKVKIEKLSL